MRKFVALFLCALTAASVSAVTVETSADGNWIVVTTSQEGELNQLTNEQMTLIQNADSVKLVGPYRSDPDFLKLQNCATKGLDLRDAQLNSDVKLIGNMKNNVESLYMPTDPNYTTIPTEFASDAKKLSNLVIPANITDIGRLAFHGTESLEGVTLPPNLQYIRQQAFEGSGLKAISIPGTVKVIETEAFIDCRSITKVIFEEHLDENGKSDVDMTIGFEAFVQDQQVLDVYVETVSEIKCANQAFDLKVTWGQGSTSTPLCTLHFPEEKAAHYSNLTHTLDEETASNAKLFHEWLVEHYNRATGNVNGWHEFVNSGPSSPDDPPYPHGKFLRTFSDYNVSRLVPKYVRAYIVTGVTKVPNGGKPYYNMTLERVFVIPKGTGVILYGNTNSRNKDGEPTLMLNAVEYDGEAYTRENFDAGKLPANRRNLLVGTDNENDEQVTLQPYEKDPTTGEVAWRNFGMMRVSKTDTGKKYINKTGTIKSDYMGFFRCKRSTINPGYAYLRLKSSEYDDADGGEVIAVKDNYYNYEYVDDGSHWEPVADWGTDWESDWGIYVDAFGYGTGTGIVQFMGEFEEDADGIVRIAVPAENVDNGYFSLQGVKVIKPEKGGVYIKDGKKVIVK